MYIKWIALIIIDKHVKRKTRNSWGFASKASTSPKAIVEDDPNRGETYLKLREKLQLNELQGAI